MDRNRAAFGIGRTGKRSQALSHVGLERSQWFIERWTERVRGDEGDRLDRPARQQARRRDAGQRIAVEQRECGGFVLESVAGVADLDDHVGATVPAQQRKAMAPWLARCGGGDDLEAGQVRTEHLVSLGAREVPRRAFLERLRGALQAPTLRGRWAQGVSSRNER